MRPPERLSRPLRVALVCARGDRPPGDRPTEDRPTEDGPYEDRSYDDWPYDDWPAPDDPYVGRVVRLSPPFRVPADADAVVLRCEDPVVLLGELRDAGVPVIVVSPRRDTDTVVEVFRSGAGYVVEDDCCAYLLSSAVMAAAAGHAFLSHSACDALREGARRMPMADDAVERRRRLLSPRERQVMELLSTGLGAQEIGRRLRLSEKTVRNNLSNIYAKLDARGGTDAVLRWLGAPPAAPVLRE